jgi:uncharacterized MAPEG superfamily protein
MTLELTYLVWSTALGLVQLVVAAALVNASAPASWGVGPRDVPRPGEPPVLAARLERASRNFLETFPFALAAFLVAHLADRHNALTEWGAALYFWGRLVYVGAYLSGIAYLRSAVWTMATLGIVMMLVGLRGE